jgi:hypothetical protein
MLHTVDAGATIIMESKLSMEFFVLQPINHRHLRELVQLRASLTLDLLSMVFAASFLSLWPHTLPGNGVSQMQLASPGACEVEVANEASSRQRLRWPSQQRKVYLGSNLSTRVYGGHRADWVPTYFL